mgnify:CR=1 FL=1
MFSSTVLKTATLAAALLGTAGLFGCQDNTTRPGHDPVKDTEPPNLTCVPNLDGKIDLTRWFDDREHWAEDTRPSEWQSPQQTMESKQFWEVFEACLYRLPEASARTAALLSNQVDWVEAPAPDAVPQIKSKGFVIYSNAQPHVWPWQLSFAEGSPWLDKRVRQAANLCVDRTGLLKLLGGMMGSPKGTVPPATP